MEDELLLGDDAGRRPKRDNLFGWTVFILLLIAFAFACWIGCYYVFGHPENPKSYAFLQKLKKIEPPQRFDLTAAPPGEFLNAKALYERYATFSAFRLAKENQELLRDYIGNYHATKKLVPYIVGRFTVMAVHELTPDDVFTAGVVALAQSADHPQVLVEQVFTATPETVPKLQQLLVPGLEIEMKRSVDLSALLAVKMNFDGRLQFTVVPLLYGTYAMRQGGSRFTLEPPGFLNLAAGFPVIRGDRLEAAYRAVAGAATGVPSALAAPGAEPVATPPPAGLVHLPEEAPPATTPTPAAAATAVAAATPAPKPPVAPAVAIARPPTTPPPPRAEPATAAAVPAMPTPVAATAIPATAAATPAAAPPAVAAASAAVPLQPFLTAVPTPTVGTATGGTWKVYPAGQMPRGRLVGVAELSDMAERGVGNERVYLPGDFSVSVTGENRAVLRPRAAGGAPTRIIVEFPTGAELPKEGAAVTRDGNRPFQITDVRRGADGQINVYVREVTAP